MADQASDYHRGEMDIQEQVSTFNLIMGITKWGSLAIAAFLLWATLWFCTETGFLGATVAAIVLIVLGVVACDRSRLTNATPNIVRVSPVDGWTIRDHAS